MWCWKRMQGIIWTGLVRNAEIIKSKEGEKWSTKKEDISIGKILHGNCLLKRIIEGRMEEHN
jgi:hypothetical protein